MHKTRPWLPIGAKLTLLYTATVSITVTSVGLFVYTQIESRINREAVLLLEVHAEELADDFRAEAAAGSFEQAVQGMQARIERRVRTSDPELRLGVELVSRAGEQRLGSGSLADAPPPISQAVLDGRSARLFRAINLGGERPYLAMAVGVPGGALRVAIDTARYADNVAHVRDVFLLSLPVLLVATATIGWALARGSLRPIALINATARRITAANLGESVPQSGSGDELDQLAGTLNEMLGRIDDAMSRMRRFNANAAHELRTPIAAVSNEIEVTLEKPREPEEYRQVLSDVLERIGQLSGTVDGMLRLARAEAGLDPEARERIPLDRVLETVQEFFAPVADEGGVRLLCESGPESWIRGDASWLHQLFSNLVANALKHTPKGGTVALRSERLGNEVRVSVSDTGSGLAPQQIERIFGRFERAGSSAEGFGLGLPIAREIARAHGGRIEAESEVGRGSVFHVWLPLADEGTDAP